LGSQPVSSTCGVITRANGKISGRAGEWDDRQN